MAISTPASKSFRRVLGVLTLLLATLVAGPAARAQSGVSVSTPVSPGGGAAQLVLPNPACAPLNSFSLRLRFDTGEDFVKPSGWTGSSVNVSVSLGGGMLATAVPLAIDQTKPESWYVITIGATNSTAGWTPGSGNLTLSATATAITNSGSALSISPRIWLEYVPTYGTGFNGTSLLTPNPVAAPVNSGGFEYTFSWVSQCTQIPAYQLQILYSPFLLTTISPAAWQEKGLLIDTGSPATAYTLTLAEGIGYYYWRVRGIGNLPGGTADPLNVGMWELGQRLTVAANNVPHPDLNWIYSRTFSEGGRVAEKLTFANGLQQVRQTQTRLIGNAANSSLVGQQVVATQTVQDYAGRDAVQSLPIPILGPNAPLTGPTVLGYKPNLLKKSGGAAGYEALDFDAGNAAAGSFGQPLPAEEQGYYTSTPVAGGINDRVANANGYPFTRTRFGPDGRVREQGGVGDAMKVQPEATTTHTARTYYAAVAPQELIRLFGEEAPEASGTYKVLSIDPNNTTSVSYQTKQGQTIATALSKASAGSSPMEPLPSAAAAGYSITEELASPTPVAGKTLVITEPLSSVTINYSLTPAVLQNSCLEYCATCDYKVRITVTKINDPSYTPQVKELPIPAKATCSPTASVLSTWVVPDLPIGEYRIQRELFPADPIAAAPPFPAVPAIDARLAELQALFTAMPNSEPWNRINDRLQAADIDGLYDYLLTERRYVIKDIDGSSYIQIPVASLPDADCNYYINLPYLPDYCHPKCNFDIDFEKILATKIDEINSIHNTSFTVDDIIAPYTTSSGNITDDIQKLLIRMEEYGKGHPDLPLKYTCQDLLACWNAQLAMLETNLTVTGNAPTNYTYNFIKEFLECTGVDMRELIDVNSGSVDLSSAFYKFTYDPNSPHDQQCLTAVYACQKGLRPADIATLDFNTDVLPNLLRFADYRPECRAQAYSCIKNNATAPGGNAGTILGQAEAEKAAQELMRTCRSTCSDRRAEFRASIIDGFHRKGISVQGDAYYVEIRPTIPTGFAFTGPVDPADPELIEACQIELLTQAVVERCQRDCQVTVQQPVAGAFTVGTEQELANMSKVMFNPYTLAVTGIDDPEGCPEKLEPVDNIGKRLLQAELTSCAQDIISYIGALARGVPQLIANPNRLRSCNVPVGTVGADDAKREIFSVTGPMRKECTQRDPNCLADEDRTYPDLTRVNHWVTIVDSRAPINDPSPNSAFDPNFDYSLIWSNHTPARACPLPAGDDVPGLPKSLTSNCGVTGSPYDDDGPFYQVYFVDNSGTPIRKEDIQDVAAVFLDEPSAGATLAPGLDAANLYTTEGISVRLTLTSGGWMIAKMRASVYLKGDLRNNPTPPPLQLDNYLQWKTLEECDADLKYRVCMAWDDKMAETTIPNDTPVFTGEPAPCNEVFARQLQQQFSAALGQWKQDQLADLTQQYQSKCQALAGAQEHFTLTYSLGYHHFTLYYYDRGGNLLRTVPPKGVSILADNQFILPPTAAAPVPNFKPRGQWGYPAHTLVTTYTYNSLHQLVSQNTPDGGYTQFYYNRKGQLRFSWNARQHTTATYSYTKYDPLGRVVEVGESSQDLDLSTRGGSIAPVIAQMENITFPTSNKRQVTTTVYSTPAAITYSTGSARLPYSNATQRHLTNRVSYSSLDADGNTSTLDDLSTTYYSYDPHGNVEWLIQQQAGLGAKHLRYEYDLISNKVLRVNYQEGQPDQFYHRYDYDGDNRLTQVHTSTDGLIWDQDARYTYFAHGPLKRMELGEDHVQGIDYTYTLQGWLKGINHPTTDPGNDGASTALTSTAKDAFAMTLGYFPGDFTTSPGSWTTTGQLAPAQGLYNGNIASWTSWGDNAIAGNTPPATPATVTGEAYRYDELNRLYNTRTNLLSGNNFVSTPDYETDYTYDANGNLLTLKRKTGAAAPTSGNALDELVYHYDKAGTNQLTKVDDNISAATTAGFDDVKPFAGTTQFTYDDIGNLVSDASSNVDAIEWTVYGKIASVTKSNGTVTSFRYDAAGNRILKTLSTNNGAQVQRTYYVRDAQGNIMATYNQQQNQQLVGPISLLEHSIYGSSRLGIHKPTASLLATGYYARTVGEKQYELTDHLGNVRAVVSDTKLADNGGTYKASLSAYYNYYAFGMLKPDQNMAGTTTGAGGYRYGYNGKEKDNNGELGLTTYDYGFRIYNPGLGKFLSMDPLTKSFAALTPYQFASNSPLANVDLDGLEQFYTANGEYIGLGPAGRNGQARLATSYNIARDQNGKAVHGSYVIHSSKPLNSEVTIRGRNEADGFKSITRISSDDLGRLLAFGNQVIENNHHYLHAPVMTAQEESVGTSKNGNYGLLDYKYAAYDLLGIDRNNLLEINGTIYNANEAGNYIWAMVLTYNGLEEKTLLLTNPADAADRVSRKSGRPDEPWDQKADMAGSAFAQKLKNNGNNPVNQAAEKYQDSGGIFSDSQSKKDVRKIVNEQRGGQKPPHSGNGGW